MTGEDARAEADIAAAGAAGYVETWKAIAAYVRRSERWCRYAATGGYDGQVRAVDRLPVFKVGGTVRLNVADYQDWLARQRASAMPRRRRRLAVDEVLATVLGYGGGGR